MNETVSVQSRDRTGSISPGSVGSRVLAGPVRWMLVAVVGAAGLSVAVFTPAETPIPAFPVEAFQPAGDESPMNPLPDSKIAWGVSSSGSVGARLEPPPGRSAPAVSKPGPPSDNSATQRIGQAKMNAEVAPAR